MKSIFVKAAALFSLMGASAAVWASSSCCGDLACCLEMLACCLG